MVNKKFQKILNIAFIVIVCIYLIFSLTETILNRISDKEFEQRKKENDKLLDQALQTGDYNYCLNYSPKLECLKQVGKEYEKYDFCELVYEDDYDQVLCKAVILNQKDLCSEELDDKTWISYCETLFGNHYPNQAERWQ